MGKGSDHVHNEGATSSRLRILGGGGHDLFTGSVEFFDWGSPVRWDLITGKLRGVLDGTPLTVSFSSFEDALVGLYGPFTLLGTNAANTLRGRGAPVAIIGRAGADRLVGGGQSDLLIGGAGRDRAIGRAGQDRCTAETRVDCER